MSNSLSIKFFLNFETLEPVHIGSGGGAGFIDRLYTRDIDGYPILPGSTLKGMIRANFSSYTGIFERKRLSDSRFESAENQLFGSQASRGKLIFSDLTVVDFQRYQAKDPKLFSELVFNTKISRLRGVVEPDHLYNTECIIPSVKFNGSITGQYQPIEDAAEEFDLALFILAIKNIRVIGAERSRGKGLISGISLTGNIGAETVDSFMARIEAI